MSDLPDLFGGTPDAAAYSAADQRLVDAYTQARRTLDDLPYTPEFERVYDAAGGDLAWGSRREAFHRLHNLRKARRLPTMGRGTSAALRVTDDESHRLIALVVAEVGTLGQRDQLLYDKRFDRIVVAFNSATGRNLSPHDAWRLVAKLAK